MSVSNDTTRHYAEVITDNADRGEVVVLNENFSHRICKKMQELKWMI